MYGGIPWVSPIHWYGIESFHSHTRDMSSQSSKCRFPVYCQLVRQGPSTHPDFRQLVVADSIVGWDANALFATRSPSTSIVYHRPLLFKFPPFPCLPHTIFLSLPCSCLIFQLPVHQRRPWWTDRHLSPQQKTTAKGTTTAPARKCEWHPLSGRRATVREGQWRRIVVSSAKIRRRWQIIIIIILSSRRNADFTGFHVGIVQNSNLYFFYTPYVLLLQRSVLNLPVFPSVNCTGDCSMYGTIYGTHRQWTPSYHIFLNWFRRI